MPSPARKVLVSKTRKRLTIVLPPEEHDAFRAAAIQELGPMRRTSGDSAAAEVLRRFIRGYIGRAGGSSG